MGGILGLGWKGEDIVDTMYFEMQNRYEGVFSDVSTEPRYSGDIVMLFPRARQSRPKTPRTIINISLMPPPPVAPRETSFSGISLPELSEFQLLC